MNDNETYDRICKGEFAEIKEALKRIDGNLRGDGEDKPGLAVRVARLESAAQARSRLSWAALIAVVGLAVKTAWEWIKR